MTEIPAGSDGYCDADTIPEVGRSNSLSVYQIVADNYLPFQPKGRIYMQFPSPSHVY